MIRCSWLALIAKTFMLVLLALGLEGSLAFVAYADPAVDSAVKDAGKHFQRGVALYAETDYRAALIEFQRAYELSPNATVLYNIGETYYQLQNYAAALTTLSRYLAESGAMAPHRHEVEQTIETLQARVGRVTISTDVPDCEVAVDDEVAGKTPLSEPILVSIGHRKVTVTPPGRSPEIRYVDVAAGDTVQLPLALGEPRDTAPVNSLPQSAGPRSSGTGLITAGWVTTGVLGAGAITTGVMAILASRDLKAARNTVPVSHDDLTRKSSKVATLSAAADILGVAAVAASGVTLTLWWHRSNDREVRVAVSPVGIKLAGTFK